MKPRHDAVDTAVDHLAWVRTRRILERDRRDAMAQGVVRITTGFVVLNP